MRFGKGPDQAVPEEGVGIAAPCGLFNRGRAWAGLRVLVAIAGSEREPERSRGWGQSRRNGAPTRAGSAPPAAAAAASPAATAPPRSGQVCAGQPQLQRGERAWPSAATRRAPRGKEEREGTTPSPAAPHGEPAGEGGYKLREEGAGGDGGLGQG